MQDLIHQITKKNSSRHEKRIGILDTGLAYRIHSFPVTRFCDGETYVLKNYFENFKIALKDLDGNDKTAYGFIVDDKTYLTYTDVAFPRKLWKREIKNVDGEEIATYIPFDEKIQQGDLAILFNAFKRIYKDPLLAFDLLYMAIVKCNESKFVSEFFVYPPESFQRFKGEYTAPSFCLFNLKLGGTPEKDLNDIVTNICKEFDDLWDEVQHAEEYKEVKLVTLTYEEIMADLAKSAPRIDLSVDQWRIILDDFE